MTRDAKEAGITHGEQSSPREVRNKTRNIFLNYAWTVNDNLHSMVKEGQGTGSIGSVPGRPADEQLVIDTIGENILTNLVRDENQNTRYPVFVLGEHNMYDFSDGKPQVVFAIDAFDNSGEFKRGLDTPVYSVLGAYNTDGSPIGSVIVDIRGQKAFVSIRKENHVIDLSTVDMHHQELKVVRPKRNSVKDKEGVVIASYVGEREYSKKYYPAFGAMEDDWSEKSRHYGNCGAFVYAFLANGAIDAYIMFDEPHSEILPGLPVALAADCTAVSVNIVNGDVEEYKFNSEFITDPKKYTHGTVDLFIASRTPELRDELVQYYLRGRRLGKPKRSQS